MTSRQHTVIEILIPLTSNGGAVFGADHHLVFQRQLITTFGGYSLMPGMVRGGWANADVVYTDDAHVYEIGVESILRDGAKVVALAELAKAHYGQLAIFVRYLGIAEIL